MSEDIGASGNVRRGLILKEQGRYPEAQNYFREALAQNPRDAFAFNQLAACQLHIKGSERDALKTIDEAIAIEPNDAAHHILKSFILSQLNRPQDAVKSARAALALDPYSPYAFTAEAQALLQMEIWREAERAAREALALDADNSLAANQLAQALRLQNKMAENAEQIAGMLARDPEDATTHSSAGWAALQRGKRREAEEHFRESLRLDPDSESAREGLLHSFRARSPIYRGYLAYCFFMQRLSKRMRWGVILALYFGTRFARLVFTGPYAPLGMAIGLLYLVLVLWVWVARGFGNFILLFDPFARCALRKGEKIEACFVGGGLALGVLALVATIPLKSEDLFILGVTCIAAAFPFSMIFTNASKIGRVVFSCFAALMLFGGATFLLRDFLSAILPRDTAVSIFTAGLFACLLSTWLGNIPALRRQHD